MAKRKVTSLDEIRAQVEPDIIEIPGFRPGTTVNVAVKPVDLTHYMLETNIGNPMLQAAISKAREGKAITEIKQELDAEMGETQERSVNDILSIIDPICKEALVEPTWDEITAIRPMSMTQKLVIFNWATGDISSLQSFRRE